MRRILTPALWLASFVAIAVAATANAYAEKRVAFVMGNGAYAHAASLPNPPNDAREVAASLERLGFDVVTASSGRDGLALLAAMRIPPRLVMLDIVMPEMDGAETLGHLRAGWPELPVVLCSGFDRQDAMTSVDGLEAAAFLQKPFGVDALGAALGVALAGRASAGDNPDLLKVRGPRA